MKGRAIKYSEEQLQFIQRNRTMARTALTQAVNQRFDTSFTTNNIKSLCTRKGWKTGRDGRYQKGNVPHPNAKPKGPNKTSFKKGHRPKNWHPIGHERLSKDGYLQRKMTDTGITRKDYVEVHRLIWEQHNGKQVPDGHIVIFIDGDKTNMTPSNLQLISRAENAVINKRHLRDVPAHLKQSGITLGRLIYKTRQAEQK